MRNLTLVSSALLALSLSACTDRPDPLTPGEEPETPPTAPKPVGVYQIEVTGLSTGEMSSNFIPIDPSGPAGISASLNNAGNGIVFEQVGATALTEGARGAGGHRYVTFTYRVRNSTGAPLDNLTIMLVERAGTVPGTALSSLRRFDGAAADPAVAPLVVPTGAVSIGSDLTTLNALYPDVIQVFTEAEIAGITPPAGVTNIFPVGFVVRNRTTNANRALPHTADANQFDGVLSLSFRLPLQASSAQDVHSFFFQILAVTDTETRLTESIEESQDTAAVRRLRERATALGASTVTVLNGSGRMAASDPDYPGQRQICSPRTAGTAAAAITRINARGSYSRIAIIQPGQSLSSCDADFLTGTSSRPRTNVWYTVQARAMDRYGNIDSAAIDTVRLMATSGPPATMQPASLALASGGAVLSVMYSDYGTSTLNAVGRRNSGWKSILVAGVTRTWTAGAGTTDWHTGGNWQGGAVPMHLDSVFIPDAAPLDPALAANVSVQGVTVENGATIALGAFNLTAGGNVTTGTSGGITNTVGSLYLAGVAKTVQGVLPRVRVTGTYSLTGNVTARAPLRVELGRLRNQGFRVRASSY